MSGSKTMALRAWMREAMLDPATQHRQEPRFRIDGGVTYAVRLLTPDEAEGLGCRGANAEVVGPNTETRIVGWLDVTGRTVTLSGTAAFGWVRATFEPWSAEGTERTPAWRGRYYR